MRPILSTLPCPPSPLPYLALTLAMPKVEISANQEHFVREALKLGHRVDGRRLDEARAPAITLHDEYGHVEVQWGATRLAVRVSADITAPYDDRPFEGLFSISTEISPMASPQFDAARANDDEVLVSRLIEKAIRRSNALDLEALCIVAGAKVWSIRADIHFLDFDGALVDSACLGVMVALQHFRKPDISVAGEDVVVHAMDERQPVALSVLHIPICVSFSFFNPSGVEENIKGDRNDEISIVDASRQEEALRDGVLVITLNKNRELVQVSKSGGLPIDAAVLMALAQRAYAIAERLTNDTTALLKADHLQRYARLNLRLLEAAEPRSTL
ncbi:Uncharacterized protein ABC855_g2692 [[Candida] zeylanoides]